MSELCAENAPKPAARYCCGTFLPLGYSFQKTRYAARDSAHPSVVLGVSDVAQNLSAEHFVWPSCSCQAKVQSVSSSSEASSSRITISIRIRFSTCEDKPSPATQDPPAQKRTRWKTRPESRGYALPKAHAHSTPVPHASQARTRTSLRSSSLLASSAASSASACAAASSCFARNSCSRARRADSCPCVHSGVHTCRFTRENGRARARARTHTHTHTPPHARAAPTRGDEHSRAACRGQGRA